MDTESAASERSKHIESVTESFRTTKSKDILEGLIVRVVIRVDLLYFAAFFLILQCPVILRYSE